jgi:hypothetical protein
VRRRLTALGTALLIAVPTAALPACDEEDRADLEEFERDVEDFGDKIEKEVDKADTDGKDD